MQYNQKGDINLEGIKRLIQLLYYTTGYSVVFYNGLNLSENQAGNLEYPSPLESPLHFNPIQVQKILTQNNLYNTVYTYQNTLHEYYLVYGFYHKHKYHGQIVLGPMITSMPNEQFLAQLLTRYNQPLQTFDAIKHYYLSLPKVQTVQFQYFEALIQHLTDYPLKSRSLPVDSTFVHRRIEPKDIDGKSVLHHPYQLEKQLHQSLFKEGGLDSSQSAINKILSYPKPSLCEGNLLRSNKNHFICSCTNVCRAAIDAGLDSETAFSVSDQLINEVEKLTTIDEVSLASGRLLAIYKDLVKKHIETDLTTPVRQVTKYVENHITETLSLNDVSRALGYSSKYLSDIFLREIGTKYKYYVNEKKIALAKSLLLNPDNTISDVSHYLNYCNPSYFGKVFKNHSGLSPKSYISRHTN